MARVRDARGFLLIEALWAAVLLVVLFGLFAGLMVLISGRGTTITRQAVLAAEARPTLDRMADELRAAVSSDCSNSSVTPVTQANGTSIAFTAPDRQQPFHLLRLSYALTSGNFTRQLTTTTNTNGPPWTWGAAGIVQTAVENITSTRVFHYYDSNGAEIQSNGSALSSAQLGTIARVTATLTVVPKASRGNGSLTAQSSATLRVTCLGS